ncbi:MAG: hypothetical protein ABEI80_05640 [Haloplanus sp.]
MTDPDPRESVSDDPDPERRTPAYGRADRAVSEVLSFILVFSLITASVGVVSVVGLGSLQDARDAERIDNAERAFEVLAANQRDIVYGGAPSRSTEIKLAETSLTLAAPTDVNLTGDGGATLGIAESRPITFGMAGDGPGLTSGVVYEMGAVLRVDRGGAVIQRPPPFQFGADRTVIHYVALQSSTGSVQRRAGSTTVLVRSSRGSTSLLAHKPDDGETYTLTITTDPQRSGAWKRYLEAQLDGMSPSPGSPCDPLDGSGTVTCTFQTDDLRLTRTTIRVGLS